ncbi:hypothetical protein [Nonomuraea sp. NPDC049400]|uniref:hypothetical protein n=1 Tax=Nonomuraea sp. NPDC049400 TaxID=3364352 RepID=UPI0037BA425F
MSTIDHQPVDGADIAEVATYVIGECARFGTRLRTLTRQLDHSATAAAEREELTQAIAYVHAALADLLITVHPIHHDDPAHDRPPQEPADEGAATRQHPSVRDLPWVATA